MLVQDPVVVAREWTLGQALGFGESIVGSDQLGHVEHFFDLDDLLLKERALLSLS